MFQKFIFIILFSLVTNVFADDINWSIAQHRKPLDTVYVDHVSVTHFYSICIKGYQFVLSSGQMTQTREFDNQLVQVFEKSSSGNRSVPMRCKSE